MSTAAVALRPSVSRNGGVGRPTPNKTLQHWKVDTDLTGVRDSEALAKLLEAERKQWQALWADVEALRKQAGGQAP